MRFIHFVLHLGANVGNYSLQHQRKLYFIFPIEKSWKSLNALNLLTFINWHNTFVMTSVSIIKYLIRV